MQRSLSTALLLATTAAATPAIADEAGARPVLEEVLVTARKRSERAIEAPVAVTAFSAEDLDTLKARDLTRLSAGLPGVLLDDAGTRRGTANFSIRGLGINSSIPSIDPAVGVFVNGVYLAVNNDTVFDIFDLERIEVLRGPQGILFGRNVTG
ncbi:MAG TPA: TonB-dependent receptor, partial [Halieaceae bacterium]|nr:TonB-dependent receptor [Halieaceae bacterium]